MATADVLPAVVGLPSAGTCSSRSGSSNVVQAGLEPWDFGWVGLDVGVDFVLLGLDFGLDFGFFWVGCLGLDFLGLDFLGWIWGFFQLDFGLDFGFLGWIFGVGLFGLDFCSRLG